MKSSSGDYYLGLDHLRALAVFMVFCWHFVHSHNIIPLDASAPLFAPLTLLSEGYTGVSLFMVLSGYLFARLTDGKQLKFGAFMLNRGLRLLPLLSVVMGLAYVKSLFTGEALDLPTRLLQGWFAPSLPQGAWSITVEVHFYLLLPALLWLASKHLTSLLGVVLVAMLARLAVYGAGGDLDYLAYHTMMGRIDQFVLGLLAFHLRDRIKAQHLLWAASAMGFVAFMSFIDHQGSMLGKQPALSPWWVVMTTIEGLFYGLTVAWYDTSFRHGTGAVSTFVAWIGRCSYSIYLLHSFVVFKMAQWVDERLFSLSNVHVSLPVAAICFLLFLPVGYLSYRFIELPFLRRRVPYLVTPSQRTVRDVPEGDTVSPERKAA